MCIKFALNEKLIKTVVLRKCSEKNTFLAHDNFCPHLGYELQYSKINNGKVVCQGHGLQFCINKKESRNTSGNFLLNFYKVIEESKNIYLLESSE